MSKLAVTVLFVVCVCLVFVQPASGADAPLGVYFDTAGTQRTASVVPGVPFSFYVVSHDVPHLIGGYEFGVAVPPEIIVLSRTVPVGTNFGTGDNFLVGTGVCVPGTGPVVLAEYLAVVLSPYQDLVVGLLPSTPSSFTPPSPGYADCITPENLYAFTCWETGGGGEGIVNPVTLTPSECPGSNNPPVADAGGPYNAECTGPTGTEVQLDGTGSSDPDGDPLTYSWSTSAGTFDDPNSPTPIGTFPLGVTTVTLVVDDGNGAIDSQDVDVTVEDTTPPELSVRLNRRVLWPPNHKWVDIRAFVTVTDVCCPDPNWRLVDVRSNEPANGKGDGNTDVDIEIITRRHVRLRSERAGGGDGRVYTFIFRARDCSNNRTTVLRRVRVPHDHSGWAFASVGMSGAGIGVDNGIDQVALVLRSSPGQVEIDGNGNEVFIAE
ncbi:MAG: hypothetical protein JSW50_03215, partial [Candidatus Latescibacterota bacterium]